MTDICVLPVAVDIEPGEDLAAYLQRLADANYLGFCDLTGHQRTARVWEDPPDVLLARLASITGVSGARLRAATLHSAYPGMVPERARTGRRYAGQPATCPNGCVDTVAARLNLTVLCPGCTELLADRVDPTPPPVSDRVRQVHREVMATLSAATATTAARDRLRRLESLMAELEPALWQNWPPLVDGESEGWRAWVVGWVDRHVIVGRYTVARPPSITATLLALTWDASADKTTTTAMLDDIAVMADRWHPDPHDLPDWRSYPEAYDSLIDLLQELGVEPRHVPTILRLPDEPIVLPEHQRTRRTAEALALTVFSSAACRQTMSVTSAIALHGAVVSARTRRVTQRVMGSTHGLRRLALHARLLHEQGLQDVALARAELREVRSLPAKLLNGLAATPAVPLDPQLCAAWVWLDATRGRPAGGPHPSRFGTKVVELDARLDAEAKLHLRDWWQHRLEFTADRMAPFDEVDQPSATGETRVS